MYLLALSTDSVPASGQILSNSEGKQLGTIVNAETSEQGQVEALAVLSTSGTEIKTVVLDQIETPVKLLNLPYELD
jgi:hypothetical protein